MRRNYWKAPSFSAIAVFALALGIGANTAIYSLADVLLLRPLQIPDLDRVVNAIGTVPGFRLSMESVSPGDFLDLRQSTRTSPNQDRPESNQGATQGVRLAVAV